MKSTSGLANIGSEFEEVRYLALSKDLASQMLSRDVLERIDESVFNLSLRLIEEYSSIIDADKRPEYFFHIGGIVDYHPHKDTLDKLVLAQQKRLVSFIKYRTTSSAYEDTREVVFAPGRIISRANTLYVLGAALADENDTYTFKYWTHLAVHRILLLSITNAVFDFDVTLPDSSVFGFPHVEPKTYRIRFLPGAHADYVRERIWAEEQSIEEEEDGGLILTVTVATESEIMNWVKSFGEHCQLLGPVAPV
jgi:hypothetical protein